MYYSKKVKVGNKYNFNYIKGLARENTFQHDRTRVEEGVAKIREDILNLLDISKRDVFFDPELGSDLERFLFEINDFVLRDMIVKCVTIDVEKAIPDVKVRFVEVDQDYDYHLVTIRLEYDIISLGIYDKLEITRYLKEQIDLS